MIPQYSFVYHSPKSRILQKTNICQICGDKGDLKRLIYCVQCKACAEHSYCLEKFHREDDGTIIWKCEDCAPSNPKNCGSEQLRKSERISHAAEAKYNRMKMQKENVAVRRQKSVRSSEDFRAECLRENDIEKRQPNLEDKNVLHEEPESPKAPLNISSEKQELEHEKYVDSEAKYNRMKMQKENVAVRRQKSVRSSKDFRAAFIRKNDIEKRQPNLEDKNVLYEEPKSPKAPLNTSSDKQELEHEKYVDSEALMSQHLYYPEFDNHSNGHPLGDPVWMGQFRLNSATDFGVLAYVSSKACSKVHAAVTALPRVLDVEILLRCAIWPKSFDMYPPNGDSIGIYLFPQYERNELIFSGVLNHVIEQELALKAVINNVELLIFSSHLLPPNDRRIYTKYYLWGVFKPKPKSGNIQSN